MATIDVNQPMVGVRYEKSNGIATITIDRTERGNSLTPGMQAVFKAIWSDVRDNPKVLVAIINAAGERHFCTGFDVAEADSDSAADEVFVDKPFRESVFWSPYQNDVWEAGHLCCQWYMCRGRTSFCSGFRYRDSLAKCKISRFTCECRHGRRNREYWSGKTFATGGLPCV